MSTGKRGFASMDKNKRAEIARKGGKAAHALGKAHTFTQEEAVRIGKEGGIASGKARLAKSQKGKRG